MGKQWCKLVSSFVQEPDNKVFSMLDVLSSQGELGYGVVSWGCVACQIPVATVQQVHGAYSAEVSKTVFHLQHQLVPRQPLQTPTDQIVDYWRNLLFIGTTVFSGKFFQIPQASL